jgi:phenylpyruvate tautomerase PptA (4-oxalocrotonate tautomerase family)
MATYSVYFAGVSLSTHQKHTIAQGITKIHAEVTGAEAYFAQVIFKELDIHDCFIGGVLLEEPHLFLSGQIRSGRSEQTIKQLLVELEISLQSTTKLAGHQITGRPSNLGLYCRDSTGASDRIRSNSACSR